MKNSKTAAQSASSAVTNYLAAIGRKGGASGTGKSKARSKSQARKAAEVRWAKSKPERIARRRNVKVSDGGPLTHESTETRTRRSLH